MDFIIVNLFPLISHTSRASNIESDYIFSKCWFGRLQQYFWWNLSTCNWANQIDISLFSFFPILWPTFKASFFPAREKVWKGLVQQCICVWFLILMSSSSYCGLIAHGDAQKWILRGNSCSWQLCDNDVVMGKVLQ